MSKETPDNIHDILEELRIALEGDNSTIPKIVEIICERTNEQRQIIKENYKSSFGADLMEKLNSKLSGDLKDLIKGLMLTPVDYDTEEIFKAIDGAGTDDDALVEIIATRPNSHLLKVKDRYPQLHKETLEDAIKGDTSKNYQALLVALIQGKRGENPYPNINKMNDIVKKLTAKDGKIDEASYVNYFANCSYSEICTICRLYEKQNNVSILETIEKEFNRDSLNLYKTILSYISDSGRYFAERIHKFKDNILIRTMISRSEIDMDEIKDAYRELYHKELEEDIKEHTKDNYQTALIILANKIR